MENKTQFYMPAEWEKHERTFLEWPVLSSLNYPEDYEKVTKGYADVIKAIAKFEEVVVIVNEKDLDDAKRQCGDQAKYLVIEHDDAWIRDNGPTFLVNNQGERKAVSWQFNAWGKSYRPHELDNAVATKVAQHYDVEVEEADFILEGGSIHSDGEGTIMTTMECLLQANRNPHLTKEEIEEKVLAHLGAKKMIWLDRGLDGDETNGHVDNVACFAKPGVVIIQSCCDQEDPNYKIFMRNKEILEKTEDAMGRKLSIIEMEQPPKRMYGEERLTLSYMNFYIANGGIILPVFGGDATETDEKAYQILQEVFPDYEVVKVDGMGSITEGGNVHCITQQMPAPIIR